MRLVTILNVLGFLGRNLWLSRGLPTFADAQLDDELLLTACTRERVDATIQCYERLHGGQTLGSSRRWHLRLFGAKLCAVVVNKRTEEVVGLSLYYFNNRDAKERTVHEGYTGLLPDARGRGVGTKVRRQALRHFACAPYLLGVSSRVSLNNPASLYSNLNLGFVERERYYDSELGEERVYLVCDLEPYRADGELGRKLGVHPGGIK